MKNICECVFRVLERDRRQASEFHVADIGCGAGTRSLLWAELGYNVYGLDINQQYRVSITVPEKRLATLGFTLRRLGDTSRLGLH